MEGVVMRVATRSGLKHDLDAAVRLVAEDLVSVRGVFERPAPREPAYLQADLTNAGDAFAVVRGMDAVVHAAAIPDPTHNPPATVFQNNLMATFNVIEAAVRLGVSRFVNISSETVPGFFFPERPFLPDTLLEALRAVGTLVEVERLIFFRGLRARERNTGSAQSQRLKQDDRVLPPHRFVLRAPRD